MNAPRRFLVLPDDPMSVRDVEEGVNYYTGGVSDSTALCTLLNELHTQVEVGVVICEQLRKELDKEVSKDIIGKNKEPDWEEQDDSN